MVTGTDWLLSIKNYKLLKPYLTQFNTTYKQAVGGLNNSTDNIPVKHAKHKNDDIVDYDDIDKLKATNFNPTETGDIMKRLEVNKLRTQECMALEDIVSRITKPTRQQLNVDPSDNRRTPPKATKGDIHFKYLKDHDLEDYYKSVYPEDKLRKVHSKMNVPIIPKFESSED